MTTYTGKQFNLLNPTVSDICIEDIAHHLSLKCRYGGACRYFYSVAQHCVHVSRLCPPELALIGLLHDAAETYTGDILPEIKKMFPYLPVLDRQVWSYIVKRFNLIGDIGDVKKYDEIAYNIEWNHLMNAPHPNPDFDSALYGVLEVDTAENAEQLFLDRFQTLTRI